MAGSFLALLKKDFKLMLSSKFFLLAIGSLLLYSCYINFFYVHLDQEIYSVYLYDPQGIRNDCLSEVIWVDSIEEINAACEDGHAVGINASSGELEVILVSSGIESIDNYRVAYAVSALSRNDDTTVQIVGTNTKEMKNRREITCEFLFFELAAVGFLGVAAMLFKEKQMGVIRVHGILPINRSFFILSKLLLFLVSDIIFAVLLTLFNLGVPAGIQVLPAVLVEAGILSLIMALVGFLCAIWIPNFKQFSLLYLVLAVFVSTPVFLVGQTGIQWGWIKYHPMYYLFMAIKNAYFGVGETGGIYFLVCVAVIAGLFLFAHHALTEEMAKEG